MVDLVREFALLLAKPRSHNSLVESPTQGVRCLSLNSLVGLRTRADRVILKVILRYEFCAYFLRGGGIFLLCLFALMLHYFLTFNIPTLAVDSLFLYAFRLFHGYSGFNAFPASFKIFVVISFSPRREGDFFRPALISYNSNSYTGLVDLPPSSSFVTHCCARRERTRAYDVMRASSRMLCANVFLCVLREIGPAASLELAFLFCIFPRSCATLWPRSL